MVKIRITCFTKVGHIENFDTICILHCIFFLLLFNLIVCFVGQPFVDMLCSNLLFKYIALNNHCVETFLCVV